MNQLLNFLLPIPDGLDEAIAGNAAKSLGVDPIPLAALLAHARSIQGRAIVEATATMVCICPDHPLLDAPHKKNCPVRHIAKCVGDHDRELARDSAKADEGK